MKVSRPAELKLPKFCLWHVAWSLNIRPAKFHATGKSCQKLILSSMASGIFRKQAKLHAAGKNCLKTNPINFLTAAWASFRKQAKLFWRSLQWILLFMFFVTFDCYSINQINLIWYCLKLQLQKKCALFCLFLPKYL